MHTSTKHLFVWVSVAWTGRTAARVVDNWLCPMGDGLAIHWGVSFFSGTKIPLYVKHIQNLHSVPHA